MRTQGRRSAVIPFGWKLHDDAPGLLVEVEDEQKALKQAIEYLDMGCSARETARWLTATTGRYLSYKGLQYIRDREEQKHEE